MAGDSLDTDRLVRTHATSADLGQIHGWMLAETHAPDPARRARATLELTALVVRIRDRAGG